MHFLKWFYPGMGVKRWLLLLMGGITILSLGIAYILVNIYRQQPLPEIFYYLTLQFIPRLYRGLLFGFVGSVMVIVAIVQLNRSLLSVFPLSSQSNLVDLVYRHRSRSRGPKIVAIGGGTGLSTLLRGLKEYTANLTAIVTVADDGGSSGRLRRELGVLPPGDFRQCLTALAEVEPLMSQLFEYRFGEGSGLNGHSFGNLFIVAMSGITGNFEGALRESSRVLAVRGRILPSTLQNVVLSAELANEAVVHGESQLPHGGAAIQRVFLQPADALAYPEAVGAILEADLIVIGPGSLYTSVLPNLLVGDIAKAIRASRALKVYVCNVATQPGETDGYALSDHIQALHRHVSDGLFYYVLANDNFSPLIPPQWGVEAVRIDDDLSSLGLRVVTADVVDETRPTRHDPRKLASHLLKLYDEVARHHSFRAKESPSPWL
ncbi:MAG: uridine diphosphate-N-acetylglucosamine-binding protein YvcK [Anaerolineae bacterium]